MHGGDAVGYNVSYSILFIPYQPFSARSVIKYVRKILGIWNKINSFATDEDHPRGCGENHVHGGYCRVYLGSPPQVRGKQKAAALDYLPIGITPADAGKTNRLYYTFIRQKKHIWHSASFFLFTTNIDFAYCVLTCSFYISDSIIPSLRHIQFDMIKRCCTFLCSAAIIY